MAIYLDYNASAPINEFVIEKMMDVYKNHIGNADSRTHDFGADTNKIVTEARQNVAELLGVKRDEVFFTSGSTESNNIAIQGLKDYARKSNKNHIITSTIEHKSVLATVQAMEKDGFKVDYVKPEENGRVSVKKILDLVKDDTLLVSIMHVNNETGVIQPVDEIGDKLDKRGVLFHIDATQSAGKLIEEVRSLKYDMLSLSAHKLQGPQGIGALILKKKKYRLPPVKNIMYGGDQEHGLRPGTTPVALVAGLGEACKQAMNHYDDHEERTKRIKQVIIKLLDDSKLDYHVNGDQNHCITSTINLTLNGVSSEALMLATKSIAGLSNGSACTSHEYKPSYVLSSMGLNDSQINNSIRVSWGYDVDINKIEEAFSQVLEVAKTLVL